MDADDYMAIGTGVDTTLSGLEERRPLTLLQLPGENGNASTRSSMSDLGSPIYERRSRHDIGLNGRLAFAIAAAALGSAFQHGYNIGVVNSPGELIRTWINDSHYNRTGEALSSPAVTLIWSWAVSVFCIGGIIGGSLTGILAERMGRKGALLFNNVFAIIGGLLEAFTKTANSYEMLIAGRLFIGINCGLNGGLAPMYLSEISPVHLRGAVGTVYQLVVTISILVSQILGMESLLGTPTLWPILLGLTIVPAAYQLIALPFCPESPKYTLLNKGKEIESQRALTWLRGTLEVHDEMDEMRAEFEAMKLVPKTTLKEMLTNPSLRAPMNIAVMMMLAQQLSGINAVMYFSTDIFMSAGLTAETSQYATLGMGGMNVLMTVVSLAIIEKAGRKTLMLIGLVGMMFDVILLTVCLALKDVAAWLAYFSIVLIIVYVVFFATGPGSIPWFLVTELFNSSARPMATAIAVTVNWVANFIVGLGFLPIQELLGPYVFIIFAGFLAFFSWFTWKKVPETKNKTIEEISAMFRQQSY